MKQSYFLATLLTLFIFFNINLLQAQDGRVTSQPRDTTIANGATVQFYAQGDVYQSMYWFGENNTWLHDGTYAWGTISGSTSPTLTISNIVQNIFPYTYFNAAFNRYDRTYFTRFAYLYFNTPPVTANPTDQIISEGGTASFTSNATGYTSISWQTSYDNGTSYQSTSDGTFSDATLSGSTTTKFVWSNVKASNNGVRVRFAAKNSYGTNYSNAATLNVYKLPVFNPQPTDQTTGNGGTVTFTTNVNNATLYQWQEDYGVGDGYFNLGDGVTSEGTFSGSKTQNLTISNIKSVNSGSYVTTNYQFRLVVKAASGSEEVNSNTVKIKFSAPVFTLQPTDQTTHVNDSASFTAHANYSNTVKWQVFTNNAWVNLDDNTNAQNTITGSTTETLSVTNATSTVNKNQYRMSATNGSGTTYSNGAQLSIPPPNITINPTDQIVDGNSSATFTAHAEYANTVKWQIFTNNAWVNLDDNTNAQNTVTGSTTESLSFTNATTTLDKNQYRMSATNSSGPSYTSSALLTYSPPVITNQPTDQNIIIQATAIFAVTAKYTTSYQWQFSTDKGVTWANLAADHTETSGSYSGSLTARLAVTPANNDWNSYSYRVKAINSKDIIISQSAVLNIVLTALPVIKTNPTDQTTGNRGSVTFTASATGYTSLLWQGSYDNLSWTNENDGSYDRANVSGSSTDTLIESNILQSSNNVEYTYFRLSATNASGTSYSNSAKVIFSAPVIVTQPTNQTTGNRGAVTFTSQVNYATSLQWQFNTNNGDGWMNIANNAFVNVTYSGANTANLVVSNVDNSTTKYTYRLIAINGSGTVYSNSVQVIFSAPVIVTQPTNQTTGNRGTVTFTSQVNYATSLQWQFNTNNGDGWINIANNAFVNVTYSGGNTANLVVSNVDNSTSKYTYRLSAINGSGTVYSNSVQVIFSVPVFTSAPTDLILAVNASDSFTITVASAISQVWQYSIDSGNTWISLAADHTDLNGTYTGSTSTTLTLTPATLAWNGYYYRLKATNATGDAYSVSAKLTVVLTVPVFKLQPVDQTGAPDDHSQFNTVVTGAKSVIWQYLDTVRHNWYDLNDYNLNAQNYRGGSNTDTLKFTNVNTKISFKYRLSATDSVSTVYSNTATYYVSAPIFTAQPSDQLVYFNTPATFTATVKYAAKGQIWQLSPDNGNTWANLAPDHSEASGSYSGSTTTTLTVTPANNNWSGYRYRLAGSNSFATTNSDSALLTVTLVPPPIFTSQPVDITIADLDTATFSANTTGATTLQWQTSTDAGNTWKDLNNPVVNNYITGAATNNLTWARASKVNDGTQFRLKAQNSTGLVKYSNTATLHFSIPVIITNPTDTTVYVNGTATFATTVKYGKLFQWQVSTDNGATWANLNPDNTSVNGTYSGSTTVTLNITPLTTAWTGYQYRLGAINGSGTAYSNPATLKVKLLIVLITKDPSDQTVFLNGTAIFTATVQNAVSFQWQLSSDNGTTWSNLVSDHTDANGTYTGSTTNTLTVTPLTTAFNGLRWRIIATNSQGSATSGSALLTVISVPSITVQPQDILIFTTNTGSINATIKNATSYQWQVSTATVPAWTNLALDHTDANGAYTGSASTTLTLSPLTIVWNANRYRLIGTNGSGMVISNPATLNVVTKEDNKVILYPNPAATVTNIVGVGSASTISIYNATGVRISTIISTNTSMQLDISKYQRGVYYIHVSAANGTISTKRLEKL